MQRAVKIAFLYAVRALGLFALARRLTRRGLRILCYHGGSIHDEHLFVPSLFMRPQTFRRRMEDLSRGRYPVLGLGEAIRRLGNNTLPPCATVITIDDGFFSTFRDAPGPLREFQFPATIYVTTYYASRETPIFRLAVQYLFWKTAAKELDCTGLETSLAGTHSLATAAARHRLCWAIINDVEARFTDPQRCALARELGLRLGVDYDRLAASRCFNVMTAEEIRTLADAGIDIQLHTHRHRFPVNRDVVDREITDNRAYLSGLVRQPLVHFCYPSGLWSPEHWAWLEALGVVTATTCDGGLNHPDTPRHALLRFLDCDDVSSIEFSAELCGVNDYLRRARRGLKRLFSRRAGKPTG